MRVWGLALIVVGAVACGSKQTGGASLAGVKRSGQLSIKQERASDGELSIASAYFSVGTGGAVDLAVPCDGSAVPPPPSQVGQARTVQAGVVSFTPASASSPIVLQSTGLNYSGMHLQRLAAPDAPVTATVAGSAEFPSFTLTLPNPAPVPITGPRCGNTPCSFQHGAPVELQWPATDGRLLIVSGMEAEDAQAHGGALVSGLCWLDASRGRGVLAGELWRGTPRGRYTLTVSHVREVVARRADALMSFSIASTAFDYQLILH